MTARHTINPETANPASSSKRTTGARHAYLSRNGVVVISALEYRKALERDQHERERLLQGSIDLDNVDSDTLNDWQPPTRTTTRTVTTYSDRASR